MSDVVTEEEVLAAIGRAVLISQSMEAALRLCTTLVFPASSLVSVEALERQEARERRKTIGYFVQCLRQRVEVREDFDELLTSFLENRNTLIHRTSDIQGWSLHTPVGRQTARTFADRVASDAARLMLTFAGFVRAWQLQTGMADPPIPPGGEALFAQIDQYYTPLINHLVFAKEPPGS